MGEEEEEEEEEEKEEKQVFCRRPFIDVSSSRHPSGKASQVSCDSRAAAGCAAAATFLCCCCRCRRSCWSLSRLRSVRVREELLRSYSCLITFPCVRIAIVVSAIWWRILLLVEKKKQKTRDDTEMQPITFVYLWNQRHWKKTSRECIRTWNNRKLGFLSALWY